MKNQTLVTSLLLAGLLSGCAVGPTYQKPDAPSAPAFKEAQDWQVAAPADTLERGPWWSLFSDPVLDQLESDVAQFNQNIAAAAAAYEQARALVREQRAALFPSVTLNGDASRNGSRQNGTGTEQRTSYQLNIGASWEPDVWARLGRAVTSAGAQAQASDADLAAARLSAQGEVAVNYFSLRQADAQIALLDSTITAYQRTLQITQNRYDAGIAAKTDVLQAQTQLANAQADRTTLVRQRAQSEHAIAVLAGKAPGAFDLPVAPSAPFVVPDIPVTLPSTLLQRRPDIAAAERRVASANEQIGIAQSAYYPNISLGGSAGTAGTRVADLFSLPNLAWSLGLSAAQTVFNGGATGARVAGAQAAYESSVAHYRQTVLTAFQDVEDQLIASRILAQQEDLRRQAMDAAVLVEEQTMNRYRAGQVSFTEVVLAQVSALNARRTLLQLQGDRQKTAVALIQSLGGDWHGFESQKAASLK